jgi:hypothetical protein
MDQEKLLIEAVTAVNSSDSKGAAARSLGIPVSTLKDRYDKAIRLGLGDSEDRIQITDSEDKESRTVWSVGTEVRTVEDALEKANVDLNIWEPYESTINSWPTAMKLKQKVNGYEEETPHQVWNWQVKVKLRRRAPKAIQEAIKDLVADLYAKPLIIPAPTYAKIQEPHMLELSLFDAHFGKICHSAEAGHNYDLSIAEKVYSEAGRDLLAKCAGFDIDLITIPIGNDFFQTDNWAGTTRKGTSVSVVDNLFQEVFRAGCRAVQELVLLCREVAPVDLIWVPGNHDPSTSWYMSEYLRAVFSSDSNVTIDNSASPRKYVDYGVNLIGFTHGNEEKHKELPMIMATEVPQLFAKAKCREIHLGHFHKAKQTVHMPLDEHQGVRVRVLPSLSGTDSWHHMKGYVKNIRAAEAYLWGLNEGLTGTFSSSVKE